MLELEKLEILQEMELEAMSSSQAFLHLQAQHQQKVAKGGIPRLLAAAHWQLFLPFALIDSQQAKKLFLWANARKVHHWMQVLYEGGAIWADPKITPGHLLTRRALIDPLLQAPQQGAEKIAAYSKLSAPAQSLVDATKREEHKIALLLQELQEEGIEQLVVVGMGGSSIGPSALLQALARHHTPCSASCAVHFITSFDAKSMQQLLEEKLQGAPYALVLISKSGTTYEVHHHAQTFLQSSSDKEDGAPAKILVITQKDSPLTKLTAPRYCVELHSSIGGRFSTTGVIAALLVSFLYGFSCYREFLEGAFALDRHVAQEDAPWSNIALTLALTRLAQSYCRGERALCFAPYVDQLSSYIDHLTQLEMESLGKSVDQQGRPLMRPSCLTGKGRVDWGGEEHQSPYQGSPYQLSVARGLSPFYTSPVVFGSLGPQCQHTFFQWLHQAHEGCSVEFLALEEDQESLAFVLGQMVALARGQSEEEVKAQQAQQLQIQASQMQREDLGGRDRSSYRAKVMPGKRSSWLLLTPKLDAKSLGALFALHEHTTFYESILLGVNGFDQEGVELGKRVAASLLEATSKEAAPSPLQETPNNLTQELLEAAQSALFAPPSH